MMRMAVVSVPVALALFAGACGGRSSSGDGEVDAGPAIEPVPAQAEPDGTPEPRPVDPAVLAERQAAAEARAQAEAERARQEAAQKAFEETYPKHGVVYHFLAQIFAEPDDDAKVIGYMRRGAQFRAKPSVDGPGCDDGWHEVPGGGFVCRGKGYILGETPQTFEPSPVPPALDDALPYAYAYTARNDVPQYWELPTLEQEDEAAQLMAELRALDEAESDALEEPAEDAAEDATDGAEDDTDEAAEGDETVSQADSVEAPPPPGQEEDEGTPESEEAADEEEGPDLPGFLRMRMLRGFYVSLDRTEESERGRRFVRTVRGAYVRESSVVPNEPPESRGVVLGGEWELPIGIVWRSGPTLYRRDTVRGSLRRVGNVERHTPLSLADDDVVVDDRRYVLARDGGLVRDSAVRIIRKVARPPGVPPEAQWIYVDLEQQSLTAYEGDRPVFATLVSTGKEGFETPTGLYRIQSKHVSATMDDDANPDGAYSIEDVPWTMYFHGNFAIHGAFWHYTFGRPRSHGCVNLAPVDARWLFQWSTPTLPAAWHGIFARGAGGTYVYVEE